MTWVTVFWTVSAEAPGYTTEIEMAGGAMLGYWATGNVVSARPPASMITIAITQENIGLSMKKLTTRCAYDAGWAGLPACADAAGAALFPGGAAAGALSAGISSGLTVAPG